MVRDLRLVVVAALVTVALAGGSASAGPTGSCGTKQEPDGATNANVVIATVSTDGNNVKYRSGTMYAEVGADGAYAHRYGATAGEPAPASSAEVKVTPGGACAASPGLGLGYQLP